jgi:N utilization substance protein B
MAARVAAIQALYQTEMSSAPAADVIAEFRDHRLEQASDAELFSAIVANASVRRAEIDALIMPVLAKGWSLERLDSVMRALLRAAVSELVDCPDTPVRVILDQYVEAAKAFFGDKEIGFVNGVLDRLARQLRADEVEASRAGPIKDQR